MTNADEDPLRGFDPYKFSFYHSVVHPGDQAADRAPTTPTAPALQGKSATKHSHLSPIREQDDPLLNLRGLDRRSSNSGCQPSHREDDLESQEKSRWRSLDIAQNDALLLELCDSLFSEQHFERMLDDQELAGAFSEYLALHEPGTLALLEKRSSLQKALNSLHQAQSLVSSIGAADGDVQNVGMPWIIDDKLKKVSGLLVNGAFRSYVTALYREVVLNALTNQVVGKRDPVCQDVSERLAEAYVLCDPSQRHHPFIYVSDEFQKMTGYPKTDLANRNLDAITRPSTSAVGLRRYHDALNTGRSSSELLLNFRNNGEPFLNLVMCTPLRDEKNCVRFYLEAHADLTSYVCQHSDVFSLLKPSESLVPAETEASHRPSSAADHDSLFVRQKIPSDNQDLDAVRVAAVKHEDGHGLRGIHAESLASNFYDHFLLTRSYPSLRILFASPSFKKDIKQYPLMDFVSSSKEVRSRLISALENGRKITARIKWAPDGMSYWLHCTPLSSIKDGGLIWVVIFLGLEGSVQGDCSVEVGGGNLFQTSSHSSWLVTPWDATSSGVDDQDKKASTVRQPLEAGDGLSPDQGPLPRLETEEVMLEQKLSSYAIQDRVQSISPPLTIPESESGHSQTTKPQGLRSDIDGSRARRRTYKSLSPYGVLF